MNMTASKEYKQRFAQLSVRAVAATIGTSAAGLAAAALALYTAPFALLLTLLAAEVVFAIYFQFRKHQLNKNIKEQRPDGYDGEAAFQRFIDAAPQLLSYMDPKAFFTRWFFNANFDHICRVNVEELVAWGFFYRTRDWFHEQGKAHHLSKMVKAIEQAWNLSFSDGHNPDLRMMSHLWEPLPCHYRPFSWYIFTEFLALMKHIILLSYGFKHHTNQHFSYYTYNLHTTDITSNTTNKTPLLFLHGVGVGLLPYLPLLQRLASTGHPLLAVESKHLAMRLTRHLPSVDQVVSVIMDITASHSLKSFSIIGHSYGTLMASRILQLHPHTVHSVTLIDPVCFCMFSGHLVQNFVYAKPQRASQLSTWLVARDMHTAASVTRQFYWSLLNLWPEHLPRDALVVLSQQDALVPVPMVRAMLEDEAEGAVALMHHPTHAHADFIADLAWQDDITAAIIKLVTRASGSAHMRHDSASSCISLHSDKKGD